jgi:hypothetical protein
MGLCFPATGFPWPRSRQTPSHREKLLKFIGWGLCAKWNASQLTKPPTAVNDPKLLGGLLSNSSKANLWQAKKQKLNPPRAQQIKALLLHSSGCFPISHSDFQSDDGVY